MTSTQQTALALPDAEDRHEALEGILAAMGTGAPQLTDAAVERVLERGIPLTVMQCTSAYPCPPEKVGLNVIPLLAERSASSSGVPLPVLGREQRSTSGQLPEQQPARRCHRRRTAPCLR